MDTNTSSLRYRLEKLGYIGNSVSYDNSFGIIDRRTDTFWTAYYCDGFAGIICCNLKTKKIREYKSVSGGIYGLLSARNGTLYGGGVYPGILYALKPGQDKLERFQAPEGISYIWDLAEAPDGKIYGACYPGSKLWHFDPHTGRCSLDAVLDEKRDYLRYVTAAPDGKLWCSVIHPALLYVYDPGTEEKRQVLPEEFQSNSFISKPELAGKRMSVLTCSTDTPPVLLIFDAISGKLCRSHNLKTCRLDGQALNLSDVQPIPGNSLEKFYFYDARNGRLFSCGVETGKIKLELANFYPGLPKRIENGSLLHSINDQDYVCYDLKNKKIINSTRLSPSEKVKMKIFSLCTGPQGDVYGSSFINQHLWMIDSKSGKITDLGRHRIGGGQIDSICAGDGKMWIGSYTKAHIACYSPDKPWNIIPGPEQNPRDFGPAANGQYRTSCILYG
ncbi:MAG: hypothetical protein PHV82_16155, partial [Victivallaceae bacterium]|nr:hypothetical protein [Victivallaceae bacterium]